MPTVILYSSPLYRPHGQVLPWILRIDRNRTYKRRRASLRQQIKRCNRPSTSNRLAIVKQTSHRQRDRPPSAGEPVRAPRRQDTFSSTPPPPLWIKGELPTVQLAHIRLPAPPVLELSCLSLLRTPNILLPVATAGPPAWSRLKSINLTPLIINLLVFYQPMRFLSANGLVEWASRSTT